MTTNIKELICNFISNDGDFTEDQLTNSIKYLLKDYELKLKYTKNAMKKWKNAEDTKEKNYQKFNSCSDMIDLLINYASFNNYTINNSLIKYYDHLQDIRMEILK